MIPDRVTKRVYNLRSRVVRGHNGIARYDNEILSELARTLGAPTRATSDGDAALVWTRNGARALTHLVSALAETRPDLCVRVFDLDSTDDTCLMYELLHSGGVILQRASSAAESYDRHGNHDLHHVVWGPAFLRLRRGRPDADSERVLTLLRADEAALVDGTVAPSEVLDRMVGGLPDWSVELLSAHDFALSLMPESVEIPEPAATLHGVGGSAEVVFVPHSPYHAVELEPLVHELQSRGVDCAYWLASDASSHLKSTMTRLRLPWRWGEDIYLSARPRALVVQNDWRDDVHRWRSGIPNCALISKVEGIQDFADLDTPRRRDPYQHSDLVLCLGDHDYGFLGDRIAAVVVGCDRLERIARASLPDPPAQAILANLNFTYGVFDWQSERWLKGVLEATSRRVLRVTAHPAQPRLKLAAPMAHAPASHALARSSMLVSRFSTLIFEALALGIDTAYYNPHGEKAGDFLRGRSGVHFAHRVSELRDLVPRSMNAHRGPPSGRIANLEGLISIDPAGRSSSARGADVLLEFLDTRR